MKRDHPDLWVAALDEVDRRSAAGVDIRNREAYAATILPDLVEERREERQLEAKSIEDATAIADCKRCDEDGWYWEDQELPYKPKRTRCRHQPTRSDPAATDGNVPVLAVLSPMRTNAGAESRTERLNLGSDGGVTYGRAR